MPRAALVVDDSSTMRQMVAFTLCGAGYSVVEAPDGAAALRELERASFNLVITDLNMPIMDGVTFIREARRKPNGRAVPILMLTTESQEAKRQEGKQAGATGWLVKPFNPEKLLAILEKVVR
jgi:two-component system, chemotaxis family, chemotaxis protein CheY